MDEVLCTIMHHYPSISIKNFISSFKNGGLTFTQIESLYEHSMVYKDNEYKIIGAFHGVSVGDKSVPKSELPEGVNDAKSFVFGDPDSYKNMSAEQREKLTQEMMGNHKQWSSGGGIGSSKNG